MNSQQYWFPLAMVIDCFFSICLLVFDPFHLFIGKKADFWVHRGVLPPLSKCKTVLQNSLAAFWQPRSPIPWGLSSNEDTRDTSHNVGATPINLAKIRNAGVGTSLGVAAMDRWIAG